MNALQKASLLAEGKNLSVIMIRDDKEKIKQRLKQIKNNCNLVIRQLKKY